MMKKKMILGRGKSAAVCILFVLFYAAMAGVFLLALPHPRETIHYMVAGASLLPAFRCWQRLYYAPSDGSIRNSIVRTVRRSAQSS